VNRVRVAEMLAVERRHRRDDLVGDAGGGVVVEIDQHAGAIVWRNCFLRNSHTASHGRVTGPGYIAFALNRIENRQRVVRERAVQAGDATWRRPLLFCACKKFLHALEKSSSPAVLRL
jgi:hypothetical protein